MCVLSCFMTTLDDNDDDDATIDDIRSSVNINKFVKTINFK